MEDFRGVKVNFPSQRNHDCFVKILQSTSWEASFASEGGLELEAGMFWFVLVLTRIVLLFRDKSKLSIGNGLSNCARF